MEKTKLGIIQVRGIGDCIIALPIAEYYSNKGIEVWFAIDNRFKQMFEYAAPYCNFVGVPPEHFIPEYGIMNQYWYEIPYTMLKEKGCDEIISFPQHESIMIHKKPNMEHIDILKRRVSHGREKYAFDTEAYKHLKFDEYKYFVANVPFKQKWNLNLNRNKNRELELYNKLVTGDKPHIVAHLEGSNIKVDSSIIQYDKDKFQLINIDNKTTDNIFDWLHIIETAKLLIMIDSVFFNIVEQLNLPNEKIFLRRSPIESTPVIGNEWQWAQIKVPDRNTLFG